VLKWPTPTNYKELRGFIGSASYYRRFVKQFSVIANPLNQLLGKNIGRENKEWRSEY